MADLESSDIEKRENPIKHDCRRRWETFFNDSSFNGVLYVFASKSWSKRIFWGVVVLAAVSAFLTVTIMSIIRLSREPISTSITLKRESKLSFPSVTICSLSIFNTDVLETQGQNVVADLEELFNKAHMHSNIAGCKSVANKLANYTGCNVSWGELTYLTKYNLSDLIMDCSFVGKNCTDDFEPINTVGGVCYTFNGPSTQTRTVQGTGIRQGLQLQLFANNQHFSLGKDHGYRIIIHNPDEIPRPESEGIAVGLNSTVYIGMRRVDLIDKTQFYQCRRENTNQKLSFPKYPSYSPSLCESECLFTFLADQCKCSETMLYTPDSSRYDQRECKFPDICCEVDAFFAVNDHCDCPPKCDTVAHTLTVSSSTNAKGFIGVNVFYESLILETRETTDSYTMWSLISDIGGNTGLFMGFTLLSGVELFMFVVGLIKDCCSGGCKRWTSWRNTLEQLLTSYRSQN